MMQKIATVQDVLRQSADELEKTAQQRDYYKDQYLLMKKEAEVREVMSLMDERGLQPEVSRDALQADLTKKAEDGKLDIVKEAVLMSGHGGVVKLGSADDQSGSGGRSDSSRAALTSLLLTGEENDF
jgi:hypothetical protein